MKCFYHPDSYFPLPAEHPFPIYKFPEAAAILEEEGIPWVETPDFPRRLLERIHDRNYLKRIETGRLSRYEANRIGLPQHPRLFRRSCIGAWGTVAAGVAALEDGVAANLAGGTHHAFPDRGHGFCLLNDVVLAIEWLRELHPDLYVLVVDTDAHQGNGTHHYFLSDPYVFTYSIHVERNFPARKVPGDLDVGLPRFAGGEEYLERLEQTLEPAFLQFEPDLVFWVAGADVHENDRFGQLRLSLEEMQTRDELVLDCVLRWRVPLVAVYGGGYNRERHLTARLHANCVRNTKLAWQRFQPKVSPTPFAG